MRLTMHVAYLAGAFGVGAFAAFNNFTLSLWLYTMTTSHLLIALLSNTRSFEGAGNAAIMVLTIPLLADLVPRHHMGVAAGLLAASGSVAAPLAGLLGGSLSDAFGARAIFGLMVLLTGIALGLLPAVRRPRDVDETSAARGATGSTAATVPTQAA